jgi:hypothetical protein
MCYLFIASSRQASARRPASPQSGVSHSKEGTMRSTVISVVVLCGLLFSAVNAHAQYGAIPFHDPATGETYHVEGGVVFWHPPPDLTVASEGLGLAGTPITAVDDLGIQQKYITELRIVLRPAKKHKFRINYVPMTYTAQSTVHRQFVFNGLSYGVNLPITTDLKWNTWMLGYEYDFLSKDRWFVGFVAQAKVTDVEIVFNSPITAASLPNTACIDQPDTVAHACARAPIPNLGGIARVYVTPNVSITGELVGIKIPDSVNKDYRAHYVDFDLYGTLNFNNYAGVQLGVRSLDVGYTIKKDQGSFKMKGLYFGGVVRY